MKLLSLISLAFRLVGGAVIAVGLFTHGIASPLLLAGGVLLAIGLLIKLGSGNIMNEHWGSILCRWFGGTILCFFAFIPAWLFVNVIITLLADLNEIDWLAVLALAGTAVLTYFFALLAYRAFTGRGRKQDGGLLPSWVIKGFTHTYGVFGILIILLGLYQKEWRPVFGGICYLLIANRALATYNSRSSGNNNG